MTKVKVILNLSAVIFSMLLLQQNAFSDTTKVTELIKTDVKIGTGPEATGGQEVKVHYTGWLYKANLPQKKGPKFDSSVDRGEPFIFPLGIGRVIKGWDQGVVGMKVGGKRTLIIPAHLGYGTRGAGDSIPPNAALVFDVELLELQ
ncbi:MAG: FKBP-type peptidyl-prolyl cis-trans isomerase [Nitrosomonadaceae bacterium]|jgi:FKBP-type peptidyl-prolyl cis-trans isomerase FkpA|nr:FKBP-type peptidyl-prolyl cis-trans isomerase [Nitrosomonadaceae bacterium]